MIQEVISFGHVNGEGDLALYDKKSFLTAIKSKLKNSSIELIARERFYPFSDAQRAYYFAVIVTETKKAFLSSGVLKSLKETDTFLREQFLFKETLNPETGNYEKEVYSLGNLNQEVSKKMMREFCETCIIFCITSLDWAIPFPNEIFGPNEMTEKQKNVSSGKTLKESTF
jgi:hypothetical protein